MRYYYLLLLLLLQCLCFTSCAQQKNIKTGTGTITGKVDIGPLCPREPCEISQEKLKAVFDAHRVVICDINKNPILTLSIFADSSFSGKLKPGNYLATIKPLEGTALYPQWKPFAIAKGKSTRLLLEYDTGMR